jgi:hypothetical protein
VNALTEFRDASIGWLDLIAGRAGALDRFNLTSDGLTNAAGAYFVLALLNMVVQVALLGFPGWLQIALAILINALPLFAMWGVVWASARFLNLSSIRLLVPNTYAMAFILLIGLPLTLFDQAMFTNALIGALGFMLYRSARVAGGLNIGLAVSLALVTLLALVAMPVALYMLTAQWQGAA